MKRLILATSLCLTVVIINPTFGCSSSDIEYNFSEADMRAAVAGTYTGSFQDHTETVTLNLDEGVGNSSTTTQSLSLRQLQCSRSFSFVKPAAACMPTTTMKVTGQIASGNGSIASSAVSGIFEIHDVNLTDGGLTLTLADGSTVNANFQNGAFVAWAYTAKSGSEYGLDLLKQ